MRLFRTGPQPRESDPFLSLIAVAREDGEIRETLLAILGQERFQRHSLLNTWIADLRLQGAPAPFVEALAYLLDDPTAERALELLEGVQ